MRLTVGPLPPAVYWRRRAAILGVLLLVVLLVSYSCSNASDAAHNRRVLTPTTGSSSSPTASATLASTPSAAASSPAENPPADPGSDQSNTSTGGSTVDAPAQGGPCTDGELNLTVAADPASVARAAFVKFTFRIKNISNRTCTRDVGADPQELYLQDDAKSKIWSSDTCDPLHGTDVRTFKPGDVAEFYVMWNGRATNAGCTNQQPPPAGKYQLIGRLSTKLSDPSPVEIK